MDEFILVIAIITSTYITGSYCAVSMLKRTIDIEKEVNSLGLDYEIKHKLSMYIICILFSWLAYSALVHIRYRP